MIGDKYVVELKKGLWISCSRAISATMFLRYARRFNTDTEAERALNKMRRNSVNDKYENATIEPVRA